MRKKRTFTRTVSVSALITLAPKQIRCCVRRLLRYFHPLVPMSAHALCTQEKYTYHIPHRPQAYSCRLPRMSARPRVVLTHPLAHASPWAVVRGHSGISQQNSVAAVSGEAGGGEKVQGLATVQGKCCGDERRDGRHVSPVLAAMWLNRVFP